MLSSGAEVYFLIILLYVFNEWVKAFVLSIDLYRSMDNPTAFFLFKWAYPLKITLSLTTLIPNDVPCPSCRRSTTFYRDVTCFPLDYFRRWFIKSFSAFISWTSCGMLQTYIWEWINCYQIIEVRWSETGRFSASQWNYITDDFF